MNKPIVRFCILVALLLQSLMGIGQENPERTSPWTIGVWAAGSVSWYRDLGDIDQNYLTLNARWGSSLIGGYTFGESGLRLDALAGLARRRDYGSSHSYYLSMALTPIYTLPNDLFSLGMGLQYSRRKQWNTSFNSWQDNNYPEWEYLFRIQKRWPFGRKYQLLAEGRVEYGLTPYSSRTRRGYREILYSRGWYLGVGIEWGK